MSEMTWETDHELEGLRSIWGNHPAYEGKGPAGWWRDNKDRLCMTLEQLLPLRTSDIKNAPDDCGIYVLFVDDNISYIGRAICFYSRIWQHIKRDEIPFNQIVTIPCPELCLRELETYYYETFSPPFNYRRPQ